MFAEVAVVMVHARVLFRVVLAELGGLWMSRDRQRNWGNFECKQKIVLTGTEV